MGYVYARGERLWLGYWDATKKLHQKRTGYVVGEEAKARAELDKIEAEIKAGSDADAPFIGPVTVRRYAERWTKGRLAQGLSSAEDDFTRLRVHALPSIGHLNMQDIRPRHVRDLVRALRAKGRLAPRSIRHIHGALHVMFRDAVVDELIATNPCLLKRGELPRRIDKDPK
jgi:Phage integrase central domain